MTRFAALISVGAALVAFTSGCGVDSTSGNDSTSSGVSLPTGSEEIKGPGGNGPGQTYQEYYEELVEGGATPKVARCYQTHLEALPPDELEEFLAPGEISKSANENLFDFNKKTEAACVGEGGPFSANASPEEQEKTVKTQASNFGHILEAKGVPDDVISCVTEGIEALPYGVFLGIIKREAEGQNALRKVGQECNLSLTE